MTDATRRALLTLCRPAGLALGLALSGCVVVTAPQHVGQPLPADFVPGADYDISPSNCEAKGGQMIRDGNGVAFCAV